MKLLYFGACWCPSCLVMRPLYKKFISEKGIEFIEYDYDFDIEETTKYSVGEILPEAVFVDEFDDIKCKIIGEKSYSEVIDIFSSKVGSI